MKWIEVILKVIRFILNLLKKNKKPKTSSCAT